MAKVTATVSVRGVDASAMLASAKERLSQLSSGEWSIKEVFISDFGPMDEVATRDGMLPMWSGSVTAEADIKEGA